MTDSQREILLHTLGLTMSPRGKPHRNYFNADLDGKAYDDCVALEGMAYMRRGKPASWAPTSVYFFATAKGVQAAVGLTVPMADIEAWISTKQWPKRRRARA